MSSLPHVTFVAEEETEAKKSFRNYKKGLDEARNKHNTKKGSETNSWKKNLFKRNKDEDLNSFQGFEYDEKVGNETDEEIEQEIINLQREMMKRRRERLERNRAIAKRMRRQGEQ